MFAKVFKLGEEEEAVAVFRLGSHVVGRGSVLQCNDKRVSRYHATVEVTQDDVKITSNHMNPCFLKVADSKTVTILEKDRTSQLNDGDAFAFLPDMYWFKIKIEVEDGIELNKIKEVPDQNLKRHVDEAEEEEVPEKRQKVGDNNDNEVKMETDAVISISETANTSMEIKEEIVDNEQDILQNSSIKTEIPENIKNEEPNEASTSSENTKAETIKNEDASSSVKAEPPEKTVNEELDEDKSEKTGNSAQASDDSNPGPSDTQPKSRRERCWYGAQCYRKNPVHRQDFTHPGDSDYASDPEDDRPTCSFGAACYRKNMLHRRQYKHPPQQRPQKLPKKRARKKVVPDYSDDDLSDMSSEDPFIDDGESDEYVEDTDADDTDWEDSQNVDEDSENVKRLVKEANRFVKK